MGLVLLVMKNGMRPGKEQNFLINQKENPKRMIGKLLKNKLSLLKLFIGIKIDQIEENGQDHGIVNAIVAIDQGTFFIKMPRYSIIREENFTTYHDFQRS